MKKKLLYLSLALIVLCAGLYILGHYMQNADSTPSVNASATDDSNPSEPNITFLTREGQKSLTYVYSVSLPHGKTLYFGVPADSDPTVYCGSGGCTYGAYFGEAYISGKPTFLKEVSGFDSYFLDCDTGKTFFSKNASTGTYGSLVVDKVNKVVRVSYSLNANLGSRNIYHIADDGSPALIASYSDMCNDPNQRPTSTPALFRDNSYPNNFTAF